MIVYITKYALTKGIFTVEVQPPRPESPGMVVDNARFRSDYHLPSPCA